MNITVNLKYADNLLLILLIGKHASPTEILDDGCGHVGVEERRTVSVLPNITATTIIAD